MLEYKWSWTDYMNTPLHVRRVSWDLLMARREAQQRREQQQNGG